MQQKCSSRRLLYAFTSAKYLLPDIDIVFFYFDNKLYVAFNRKDQNQTSIYYNEPLSLQLPIPDLVQDSCFYYVCEPLYLPYYVDSCLMSKEDIAKMKSVKDDDNPIIIQYKLK